MIAGMTREELLATIIHWLRTYHEQGFTTSNVIVHPSIAECLTAQDFCNDIVLPLRGRHDIWVHPVTHTPILVNTPLDNADEYPEEMLILNQLTMHSKAIGIDLTGKGISTKDAAGAIAA